VFSPGTISVNIAGITCAMYAILRDSYEDMRVIIWKGLNRGEIPHETYQISETEPCLSTFMR